MREIHRDIDEEIDFREKQRRRYFEDPNYRRWSDIVGNNDDYGDFRDEVLFIEYVANADMDTVSIEDLRKLLENGHELPINWSHFYEYFDERANDPDNPYAHEITKGIFYSMYDKISVIDLLNEYREYLLSVPYDIV